LARKIYRMPAIAGRAGRMVYSGAACTGLFGLKPWGAPLLRLATWNINSVRLRIDLVRRLLEETAPDVLCLQETKTPDEHFPREAFAALGYRDMLVHGMKGYNGIAVLSRLTLDNHATRGWCERADCRHAVVELPGGIELHNVYI